MSNINQFKIRDLKFTEANLIRHMNANLSEERHRIVTTRDKILGNIGEVFTVAERYYVLDDIVQIDTFNTTSERPISNPVLRLLNPAKDDDINSDRIKRISYLHLLEEFYKLEGFTTPAEFAHELARIYPNGDKTGFYIHNFRELLQTSDTIKNPFLLPAEIEEDEEDSF